MNLLRTEAKNAFGNGDLYFEKYFDNLDISKFK